MEAHRVPQGQGGLLPLASALVSCPAKQCNEDAWGGGTICPPHRAQQPRTRACGSGRATESESLFAATRSKQPQDIGELPS